MTSVFVSRPTWVEPRFEKGLGRFLEVLQKQGLRPRTLGRGDYAIQPPLDEVIALMDQCAGAVILGYPQIHITAGKLKAKAIPELGGQFLLGTEWNHIEAGLAYAKGLPLLVIHHRGVRRGIFDRGAMPNFIHEIDLADCGWPSREAVRGALDRLTERLRDRFVGVWRYEDSRRAVYERQFTATRQCYLYKLVQQWGGSYRKPNEYKAIVCAEGKEFEHVLCGDGTMRAEDKWVANRV